MNGSVQDLRYALRQLHKSLGFIMTLLTLALAIAISTMVFNVMDAMLFRPLPYCDQGYSQPASYPECLDWQCDNHMFSALGDLNTYGSANFEASAICSRRRTIPQWSVCSPCLCNGICGAPGRAAL